MDGPSICRAFLSRSGACSERREAALKIGDQIVRVFKSDVKADTRAARRPLGRGPVFRAIEQDRQALKAAPRIAEAEECELVVLYPRQEGRGIGLVNKVRAYALQDHGLDTVDANLALGFRDDERDYAIAAHMLASLNVTSVQLMTNNPDKIRQLEQHGIRVAARVPLVVRPNEHNRFYLETKAVRSGHYIDSFGKRHLPEQGEPVVVGA